MKTSYLKTSGLALLFAALGGLAHGQARSNISFGYGVNKPFSNQYDSGKGFIFQGTIPITDKLAISPGIGYEGLNSARLMPASGSYYDRVSNIDLFNLRATGRYYFLENAFAAIGPIFYAAGGNEDLVGLGIGGGAAAGYDLNLTDHSTLMFTIGADVIDLKDNHTGTTSVASFKVAYVFNFRKKQ
jgi:hypothetical protein